MSLASMVRALVSLVDVPDAISIRALLEGTPFNVVLGSAAYYTTNTQEFSSELLELPDKKRNRHSTTAFFM
jgi:hypothetical protein